MNSTPLKSNKNTKFQAPSEKTTDSDPSFEAYTFVRMEYSVEKMANTIRKLGEVSLRLCKSLMEKSRLQLSVATRLETIKATTTITVIAPTNMQIFPLLYNMPDSTVFTLDKFHWTQGVNTEVLATQLRIYLISRTHLFINYRSDLVFSLLYPTGVGRRQV